MQTAILPAETLESGETVGAFSVDTPGLVYIPRLGAQVTHGLGAADVTANLNAVPIRDHSIIGGGLTARAYLTPNLGLIAQFQGASFSGQVAGLALVGLRTIPSRDGGFYAEGRGGVVRGGISGYLFPDLGTQEQEDPTPTAPMIGGTVGYGPIKLTDSADPIRMQIELKTNIPIWRDDGESLPLGNTGLSIGIFNLIE